MKVKIDKIIKKEVERHLKSSLDRDSVLSDWKSSNATYWETHIQERLSEDYDIYLDKDNLDDARLIREFGQNAFKLWKATCTSYLKKVKAFQKEIIKGL